MNKKLKKGLTISTAAMAMGVAVPVVTVMAAPVTANGWVLEGTTWYYYVNGVKLVNAWAQDSKGWCWLGADGAAIKEGWAKDSIGWCYITNYNWDKTSTWRQDSAGWQFIGANGYWDASIAARATNPLEVFEVSSVKVVDATHIKVAFTQSLDADTAEDVNNYTIGTLDIDKVEVQSDGKSVVITLVDALTNDTDKDYTVKMSDIKDEAGKTIPSYKEILTLFDNVKPTVESVDMTDRDTVQVTFSEAVNVGNSTTYLEVLDADGYTVDGLTIEKDGDIDDGTVWNITGLSASAEGDYTLKVKTAIKDLAGNKIVASTEDVSLADDTTKPTVKDITVSTTKIFKITFSEAIKDSAFKLSINGTALTEGDNLADAGTDYIVAKDGKEYTVTLKAAPADVTDAVVLISGYVDYSGNAGKAYAETIDFEDVAPKLESTEGTIETINGDKYAVFTFDQNMNVYALADLTGYYTNKSGIEYDKTIVAGKVYTGLSAFNDANSNGTKDTGEAYLYNYLKGLDKDQFAIKIGGLTAGDYTMTINPGFATANGVATKKKDITFAVATSTVGDVAVESAEGKGDYVLVTFTGEVDPDTALDPSNYEWDGDAVFDSARFTTGDNDQVKVFVEDGAISTTGTKELTITGIKDADGNDIGDAAYNVTLSDSSKPYIKYVKAINLNKVLVTFNEKLKATPVVDAADFYIEVGSDDTIKILSATTTDNINWTLTIDPDDAATSSTEDIYVATSKDFDGEDLAGNAGVASGDMKKAVWSLDNTSPTATLGTSTASKIVLVPSELSVVAVVTGGTFDGTTTVDGYEITLSKAAVSGNTVKITVTDMVGLQKAYTATFDGTAWTLS